MQYDLLLNCTRDIEAYSCLVFRNICLVFRNIKLRLLEMACLTLQHFPFTAA